MNSLIFWLYLADIVPNIGTGLVLLGIFPFIIGCIVWVPTIIRHDDAVYGYTRSKYKEGEESYISWYWRLIFKKLAIVCPILFLLGLLMPSQKFMYTAIALKTGEQALTAVQGSEVGQKAYELLNQKLDKMLESDKSGTNK